MADQPDNIFGSTPATAPQGSTGTEPNANTDDLATLLGAIKNERGEPKYKNVQEALKALGHAQEYIPALKSKEQELEQKLNDAMTRLTKMETLEATVLELTQRNNKPLDNQPTGSLSAEQVAELVRSTLTETQTKAAQTANLDTVVNAAKAKFGDKAEEVFYGKAKELGISVAEFNAMAAKSPKVVLTLIGAEGSSAPTRQSVNFNTDGFQPKPDSKIGRNQKTALTGATNQDLREERDAANAMVDELHAAGKSVHDLTDPKVYFKTFGAR